MNWLPALCAECMLFLTLFDLDSSGLLHNEYGAASCASPFVTKVTFVELPCLPLACLRFLYLMAAYGRYLCNVFVFTTPVPHPDIRERKELRREML